MNHMYLVLANGRNSPYNEEDTDMAMAVYKTEEEARNAINRVTSNTSTPSEEKWEECYMYITSGYEVVKVPSL